MKNKLDNYLVFDNSHIKKGSYKLHDPIKFQILKNYKPISLPGGFGIFGLDVSFDII